MLRTLKALPGGNPSDPPPPIHPGGFKKEHRVGLERLRFLIRLLPLGGDREVFLSTIRSVATNIGIDSRNPKWTSSGALELDIFAPSKEDFALFLVACEPLGRLEFWRDLNVPPKYLTKEELVAEAREFFNSERYWECHETLEALWRTLTGDEKLFVQGVILVCAAFVHHQKSEEEVALSVLRRAASQLNSGEETYVGIDVEMLRHNVDRVLTSRRFFVFRI
jgi:hypothetical protein